MEKSIMSQKLSLVKKSLLAGILACVLAITCVGVAHAGTLFTYNGTDIHSKASVNSAYTADSNRSVMHSQTKVYSGANYGMTVRVQRQDGFSWTTVGAKTYLNNVSNGTFSTHCTAGTYRLYFESTIKGYTFNISGKFYN